MSRADGVLVVSLTYKWFDMIESGEKLEEYRGEHWAKRLIDPRWMFVYQTNPEMLCDSEFYQYHILRAQRAYSGVWLERKIKRIYWGMPRPEWSGNAVTGECFIIELEPKA